MGYMGFLVVKALNFRNFTSFSITPSASLNIITGQNGSGKTSLLESLYVLGMGKSFRNKAISRVVQHEKQQLSLFAHFQSATGRTLAIGVEKSKQEGQTIRIDGENANSIAEVTQYLPIQLINPDGYKLLESGPKYRRQFMDWGVFHVEHCFYDKWKRLQRCLAQRNAALKDPTQRALAKSWDPEFIRLADDIDAMRQRYVAQFSVIFQDILRQLIDIPGVAMQYARGWQEQQPLEAVLKTSFSKDLAYGYTLYGPQRADLILTVAGRSVLDVLSRGQQKILICALRLAQGLLLKQSNGKNCIYLLDDLASELDDKRRGQIFHYLSQLQAQVFVTGIERRDLQPLIDLYPHKLFHVEQGDIRELAATPAD